MPPLNTAIPRPGWRAVVPRRVGPGRSEPYHEGLQFGWEYKLPRVSFPTPVDSADNRLQTTMERHYSRGTNFARTKFVNGEFCSGCVKSCILVVATDVQLQDGFEERGGATGFVLGDLFGGALGDEVAAFGAGFGADVDEVVGFGEDVGVVLDDDDGVAFIDEAVEDVDEAFHDGHVEADGGFFDEVEVTLGVLEAARAFGGGAALAVAVESSRIGTGTP
jgi:hypothetical protein